MPINFVRKEVPPATITFDSLAVGASFLSRPGSNTVYVKTAIFFSANGSTFNSVTVNEGHFAYHSPKDNVYPLDITVTLE